MKKMLPVIMLLCITNATAQMRTSTKVSTLMGSRFEITAVSEQEILNWKAINAAIAEIHRIENLISSWKDSSETSRINRNAGQHPVKVSKELFELITRALKVSELTHGAFDISFASMDKIWAFNGDTIDMPDPRLVAKAAQFINYKNIVLDPLQSTVFLKESGMKIGFGAIGKGYSANRAKAVMNDLGIHNGLVNAGGDLIAWGRQANGKDWQIGIADPKKEKQYVAWLSASDLSIVTSGDYEKYVVINGQRYAHIIDPRTGYPAKGIKSVTIISPDAELSDALATSIFVMGVEKGLALINGLKNIETVIVDDQNKMWTSKNLVLNYY